MKTSELTGPALDWAVAKCEGNVRLQYDSREGLIINNILGWIPYRPSLAWQQGGPIIEREGIAVRMSFDDEHKGWTASVHEAPATFFEEGSTPLIAAMRCYVASKLGEDIDIPEELT